MAASRNLHLLARAFRPKDDGAEALYVVVFTNASNQPALAWAIVPAHTEPPADVEADDWSIDLAPLAAESVARPMDRSWERIDFFRDDVEPGQMRDAKPRLSFDTLADTGNRADVVPPMVRWMWSENNTGKVAPTNRTPSGAVSQTYDRSCLYVVTTSALQRYLVANVRLRNVLAGFNDARSNTWQIVVPIGSAQSITPGVIWGRTGDLMVRDIFAPVEGIELSGVVPEGYSYARDVGGKSTPVELREITTEGDRLPEKNASQALAFNVGDVYGDNVLEHLLGGSTATVGFLRFPVRLEPVFTNPPLLGGLELVADRRRGGAVRLRTYVSWWPNSFYGTGAFYPRGSTVLVQEQWFGDEGSRRYEPRGGDRDRFVEWRVSILHSADMKDFVDWWNDHVACPLVTSLRSVHDGSPLSFVPSLRLASGSVNARAISWLAAVSVRDHVSNNTAWRPADARSDAIVPDFDVTSPVVQPATFVPGRSLDLILDGTGTVEAAAPVLAARLVHTSLVEDGPNGPWAFGETQVAVDTSGVSFGLELESRLPSVRHHVRVGALDLTLVKPEAKDRVLRWRLFGATRPEPRTTGGHCAGEAPLARIEARLPVEAAAGSVDRLFFELRADVRRPLETSGDREARDIDRAFELDVPVVIDLDAADAAERFELYTAEAVGDGRNHDLAMSLFSLATGASRVRRIMVLDRTPFGVYLARTPSLASLASAETGEVAVWSVSGDGGAHWRLAERPGGVEIILPPQGIGEAMLKDKAMLPAEAKSLAFPLPFRFTPHATLVIDPSFEDQRYGEVPWNVRRLFGYAEQRAPGSRLRGFDVELLYGLTGHAEGLDGVLVSESEARLGRPPGRQADALPWTPDKLPDGETQENVWRAFRRSWSRRWAQLASRLAVLETYRLDGNQALIAEGLRWRQRGDARLRFPLPDPDAIVAARPWMRRDFFRDDGLQGGWSWGFTSLNVLDAVLRDPEATSGFVTGLKFSALGGWGFLKASFDEDRTSIYADVVAGRTQMYSLERIGRISVLWHRAKHVIVYERTVAPSEQFAPEQTPELGWPILRKVAEYVELLEPDRGFPDSNAERATRGCVLGVAFKTVRIPVNSTWGEDVRDIGWKVPLWNPRDGRKRSTVYPRPQVAFRLAVDPEADVKDVGSRCATPELLYFYTDTRRGTGADTDRWDSILGVDFGVSATRTADGRLEPAVKGRLDLPMPPEVSVPPGLHQWSFGLEPAERPANLTVDRAEGAINASLRYVTLMRAAELPTDSDAGPAGTLLRSAGAVYGAVRQLEQKVKTEYAAKFGLDRVAMVKELEKELDDVKPLITKLKTAHCKLPSAATDVCAVVKTNANAAFTRWANTLFAAVTSVSEEVVGRVQSEEARIADLIAAKLHEGQAALKLAIEEADKKADAALKSLKVVVDDAAEGLGRGVLAASHAVIGVHGQAIAALDSFDAEVAFLRESATALFEEAKARLQDLADEIPASGAWTDRERWFAAAADARARVRTITQQVIEGLDKAERSVTSQGDRLGKIFQTQLRILRAARGTVSLGGQRIDELLASILALQTRAQEVSDAIRSTLYRAKDVVQDVKTKVDNVLKGVQIAIVSSGSDQARAAVDEARKHALKWINDYVAGPIATTHGAIDNALGDLRETFDDWLQMANIDTKDVEGVVAKIRGGKYASEPVQTAIETARRAMRNALAALRDTLLKDVDNVCKLIAKPLIDWLTDIDKALKGLVDEAATRLKGAVDLDGIRRALEQTADVIVGDAASVFEQTRRAIEDSPVGPVLQQPDRAIRLLRAFGDPPRVPKLDFNRAATAFVFGNPKDAIDMTPVTAWFDQVGDDLRAVGIRLPTDKLLDRLLPRDLTGFDFSKLLPDFAGIKLDRLLPGLRAPAGTGDGVRVTHGLDKQRQRAWAEATVAARLPGGARLFAFGPLSLTLFGARFDAVARLEAGLDGRVERRAHGTIVGDWRLDFGGQTLVTFRETTLSFDETGHTRFDLSPDRMEMAAALRYLTDLSRKLQYDEGGFVFRVLERNGIPYGAEAVFEVALPPLQYGTTGLIGATIGAAARLVAYPDFAIELAMHVSRKDSPFIFSVFILGGAGYVEASALYLPFRNALTVDVSIGISASASLAFAFGPIHGQVAVMIGVGVEYHRRPGQRGGGLGMSLRLLILGRADVMSIVTIHIALALEATYHEGGRVTARGSLSVTVRISSFFKIRVTVAVAYDFSSGKSVTESSSEVQAHQALTAAKTLAKTSV